MQNMVIVAELRGTSEGILMGGGVDAYPYEEHGNATLGKV